MYRFRSQQKKESQMFKMYRRVISQIRGMYGKNKPQNQSLPVTDKEGFYMVVNRSDGGDIRVNIRTQVNLNDITEQTDKNGRACIVIPSKTLPDNVVMNRILYPAEEIEKGYQTLEGTPAPMGHPMVDGVYVPASHPEAYQYTSGVINRNVKRSDGVVHLEKWVDIEYAERNHPRLIEAINTGAPIHTSTGLILKRTKVEGKKSYDYSASDMKFDHDAILLDEPGAAGPDQGVGMNVNSDQQMLVINSDLASDQTAALSAALPAEAWYLDHDAATVYYEQDGKEYAQSYTEADGVVLLAGTPQRAVKKTVWEVIKTAVNGKTTKPKTKVNKMDEEQKAALAELIAAAVEPITESLEKLAADVAEVKKVQDEQEEERTEEVNRREASQRAVVEKTLGKEVAEALTGNALATAFAKCQSADPISGGFVSTNTDADPLAGYTKE